MNRILISTAVLALLSFSGCNIQPADSAATSAMTPVGTPIGPVPGGMPQPQGEENPYARNAVARNEGRQLFVHYNCSGCHGGHAGGGMGPSLRDQDWIYGNSDAHIFDSIAQGRANGMPSWGARIPSGEIWKLVAYITSLRTPDEPDAPEQQ
ncbi:MAG TPA: c-type cytochrome [Bryobacteraceae bacterium]|nr:c-type cytochrome [Bryobacteraceae bacterium]